MRLNLLVPTVLACAISCGLSLTASRASAQEQVGYPPSQSPYRDIDSPQRLTLFGGYFSAGKDDIGAAPGSGPLLGLRYELTVSGPAEFIVRFARISSDRKSYDPTQASGSQYIGTTGSPIYMGDLGFSFDLTGHRSWHHIVPTAGFALGAVYASTQTDRDPYDFGTQFEFSTEFGIRYTPRRNLEGRFTVGNTLYQTHYPNAYYATGTTGTGTTALLGTGVSKSSYRNNWMFTAGLAFPIF